MFEIGDILYGWCEGIRVFLGKSVVSIVIIIYCGECNIIIVDIYYIDNCFFDYNWIVFIYCDINWDVVFSIVGYG